MAITQFLGAFNDNLFKQLILLLATPVAVAGAVQEMGTDRQGEATVVFALAFVIFSGYAGWLADRYSKRSLIVNAKIAEIVIMVLGMIGFYFYDTIHLAGMFAILFLMGAQSAFFGPPKYGILPEKVKPWDLPAANGIFLMFTFVAIIIGTVLAGILLEALGGDVSGAWKASAMCVMIAVVGTATSLLVWRVPPAAPKNKLRAEDLFIPGQMIRLILGNRQLLLALMVTSTFWMLGSVVQLSVNALGKTQLGVSDGLTSLLTAMMAVGIPIGCLVGGYLSKRSINPRVVAVGAAGMFVCLALLSLPGGPKQHLLGFWGSIPALLALGFFTGMFVVPIQVSLQVLPPPEDKGRMIAVMNQCNFVGILLGGVIFKSVIALLEFQHLPRNLVFGATAAIMLPIALFYRPEERSLES
jgi:acyl-[acyl-carrier-protein]-phospholipid O-acyltransferase/long-chain-fatty-acid--[acyl-carrier-protein] ligase